MEIINKIKSFLKNFIFEFILAILIIVAVHSITDFLLQAYRENNIPVYISSSELKFDFKQNPYKFPESRYESYGLTPLYKLHFLPQFYCLIEPSQNNSKHPQMMSYGKNGKRDIICEGIYGAGTIVIGYGYSIAIAFNLILFGILFLIAKYKNWVALKKVSMLVLLIYIFVFVTWFAIMSSLSGLNYMM